MSSIIRIDFAHWADKLRLRRQSFSNLSRWLTDCKALASPHLVVVLVGNKLDREDEREVEYAEASRWAQENGMITSTYVLTLF